MKVTNSHFKVEYTCLFDTIFLLVAKSAKRSTTSQISIKRDSLDYYYYQYFINISPSLNLFFSSKHNFVLLYADLCSLSTIPPPPPNMLTSSQMYQQLICYKTSQRPTEFRSRDMNFLLSSSLAAQPLVNMALEPVDCNQKCPICDWNSESGSIGIFLTNQLLVCLA